MKTVVRLFNNREELDRIELDYDDATLEELGRAVVRIVQRRGGIMNAGETITIRDEKCSR